MHFYKNGNYSVMIYPDGSKVRQTDEDEFIPSFSECCDVKITDYCDGACAFCYEGCSLNGKHANLFKYDFINSLHPYTEMALNGNDLSHSDLEKFLIFLKNKKVIANMTVNQMHFEKNYEKLFNWSKQGLIHGLGVSLRNIKSSRIADIISFPNSVIHTIVGIFTEEDYNTLKDKNAKVLFLGYKDLKRGSDFLKSHSEEINKNIKWLSNYISDFKNHFNVISFDNLAIKQLELRNHFTDSEWEKFYMGDDGQFTFYVDMVKGEFARNSLSQKRYPIGKLSIDEMFKIVQNESSN